jgi:hypothetical protein
MKPTQELLLELDDITAGELLLMVMWGNYGKLAELKEFAEYLPAPLMANFVRAMVNAPADANELMLETTVDELMKNEYPELYELLEAEDASDDEDDDLP